MPNPKIATFSRWIAPLAGLVVTAALIAQARGPKPAPPTSVREASSSSTAASVSTTVRGGRVSAEGRVTSYPGAEVTLGSDLRGTIERVWVEEKQSVRRGDRLVTLRAEDLRASLAEARARLAETDAELRLADLEVGRAERLVRERVEAEQFADRARRNREVADARCETARATVRRLAAELDKASIESPIDGTVTDKLVDSGETVDAGEGLLTVTDLRRLRIEAEVDEFDIARVVRGAAVRIRAEGFDDIVWPGTIEEIPDTVVSRRLKPQDPGRPEDTRVLLVKISFSGETPLKLGQRVEVEIGG